MKRNLNILKSISEYNHHTSYGTPLSYELIVVFRIKNLLLFAFKLLQKYEQVTQSACALIKKNILLKQLHLAEQEVSMIEKQIEYWKSSVEAMEGELKDLRQKLISLGKFPPHSGYTKIDPFCQLGESFENDMFLNCDDIFYKKAGDTKLSEAQFVLFPQKPPLEYYRDLIYLQMHFNLLLVQGFNFALPLLTTRFSFLNRIIYWPHQPQYGFQDKSKQLQHKLNAIKLPIIKSLKELINAIAEVDKWILFSLNSHDVFSAFMKGICLRKRELYRELHKYKVRYKGTIYEHNRLIGAIAKVDKTFFNKNKKMLNLDPEPEARSFSSTEPGEYTSVSAFSNYSEKKPSSPVKLKENSVTEDKSLPDTNSDLVNFNFLPSDFQTDKSKVISASKSVKPVWFQKPRNSIPSVGRSSPRLKSIFSAPDNNLFCQCPVAMPPIEKIRQELLNLNVNNASNYSNINNSLDSPGSRIRRKMNKLIDHVKFDPRYRIIQGDKDENNFLLKTISHEDQIESKDITREETITDRSIILNLLSNPLQGSNSIPPNNKSNDCFRILNSFFSSLGCDSSGSGGSTEIDRVQGNTFANDVFHSLEFEQDVLHQNYISKSFNENERDNPVIYNEESNLMDSLKLYSKYAK